MKKIITFFSLFLLIQSNFAQTSYKTIKSQKLGEDRELKIQLPRNYDSEKTKRYPLVIVLDGDYLFEPMAGSADYFSYWDEIPQCIIVGVNQQKTRFEDTAFDKERFLPHEKSAKFFEFLGIELLPYLDQNFRTSKFVMIAGHDTSANFINYYLLKEKPLFSAYLNLSPDLAPEMANRLTDKFRSIDRPTWFYLATASNDVPQLRDGSLRLDDELKKVENENFNYIFDDFEGGDHYTFPARAIPAALENIFEPYSPISSKDYNSIVIAEGSPFEYLENRYKKIEEYFDIKIPIRKQDLILIGKAIEERKQWEELEKLGRVANVEYPDYTLGTYYLARALEETGKPKKAMQTYRSAFGRKDISGITVDFMMARAEAIKRDFNY